MAYCTYLHLFVDVNWITQTPVIKGKIEIHTSTCIIRLCNSKKRITETKKINFKLLEVLT